MKARPRVVFAISNDKHHVVMMLPVARRVARFADVSFLSFCEFRGFRTPREMLEREGFKVSRVPPFEFRKKASLGAGLGDGQSRKRLLVRRLVWLALRWPTLAALRPHPQHVVVPHDSSFPFNRVCEWMRSRKIGFTLVQEGIRFPLPGEVQDSLYGRGGAAVVACWGEVSAAHLEESGVPAGALRVTGNPRFDEIVATDWASEAARLRAAARLPPRFALFLSNPIDDLGFCSTTEKMRMFRDFVTGALPTLLAAGLSMVVKLHPREPEDMFRAAIPAEYADHVLVEKERPLHALLEASEGAVLWASTVGLESLMHGKPIGVLEIPGYGHVFDYVASGVAAGITWGAPLAPQLQFLLSGGKVEDPAKIETYLERHLAFRGRSTETLAGVIEEQLQQAAR